MVVAAQSQFTERTLADVNVTDGQASIVSQIRSEHERLIAAGQHFDLKARWPGYFALCKNYAPHDLMPESNDQTRDFTQRHGIWTDTFENYVTMTGWIFPRVSDFDRLNVVNEYNALLFFIDDTVSVNFEGQVDEARKAKLHEDTQDLLAMMADADATVPEGNGLASSTLALLAEMKRLGVEPRWLGNFIRASISHISEASGGAEAKQASGELGVITLQDYVWESRVADSGMRPEIAIMEFAANEYIDYDDLATNRPELLEQLGYARSLACAVGALANDIFSFHKEVIVAGSDYNAIPVIMRERGLDLMSALGYAADYVNGLLTEYQLITSNMRESLTRTAGTSNHALATHLDYLDDIIKATLMWQLQGTDRYQGQRTLLAETDQSNMMV